MISRGTTPTYTLKLPNDIDLSEASAVYVTFTDLYFKKIIEKKDDELVIDTNTIDVYLTQEETLKFPTGEAQVQVNYLIVNGTRTDRIASEIKKVQSCRNLHEEVME